ncbi:MAG: hypothetical protein ABI606_01700 [Rhodoferax sp.]
MLLELARPFAYLTIQHRSRLPKWVNWIMPVVVSVIAVALPWALDIHVNIYGDSGVISRVLGFVQSLAGFYIAALAAIATFNNPDMDKLMPGEAPTMQVYYNAAMTTVKVTRRRFLSSMFAYLTACSLVLTLISIMALAVAQPLAVALPSQLLVVVKTAFIVAYLMVLSQMICVTLWGLYYLGERIHTPDA